MIAAHNENFSSEEIIELLIENGADIEAKDNDGNSIFHIAAMSKNYETVKYLCTNIKFDPK